MKTFLQTPPPPSNPNVPPLTDAIVSPQLWMLAGLGVVYAFISYRENNGGRKYKSATSRWAGPKERALARRKALRTITERKHNQAALYLGRPGEREQNIFLTETERGALVVGGSGTGKTYTSILPAIYSVIEQGKPLIVYDFKYPTLTRRFVYHAAKYGYNVRVFAPGYPESEVCNPIDFLANEEDALMASQFAEVLNRNFQKGSRSKGEDPFFSAAGDQLVQALLMLIRGSEYPDLMLAQSILSLDKLPERLMAARESINPWIYSQLGMLLSAAGSEKTVSSILAMANKVFTTFMKPEILSAFCGKTTFPTKIEGKTLLVLGLNREYGDTLSPLLATILDLLVTKNVTFQRKDQLCLFLDEMPTLYLPRISGWVTQNREDGLAVLIGIQNKVQLEKIYSKEEALEIMGSCANKNIYNPQDLESAKFYSDYIGDTAYIENQRSRGRSGSQGSSNTTRSEKTKKLISPEEIDRMPQGKALIITPGHADRKEAYIPLLHQFKPSKEYTDLIALNERKWDESIRQKLIERSQQKVYIGADLKMRFNYADRWFPVPAGGKAQKTNPNNIAGGIPDNDVIAQGKKLGIDRTSFTAHLKNY